MRLKIPRKQASSRELSLVIATKLCFMGSYSDVLAPPHKLKFAGTPKGLSATLRVRASKGNKQKKHFLVVENYRKLRKIFIFSPKQPQTPPQKKSATGKLKLLTCGSFEGLGSRECALTIKTQHKTFRTNEQN